MDSMFFYNKRKKRNTSIIEWDIAGAYVYAVQRGLEDGYLVLNKKEDQLYQRQPNDKSWDSLFISNRQMELKLRDDVIVTACKVTIDGQMYWKKGGHYFQFDENFELIDVEIIYE
jgi:hypothetical protein